MVLEDLLPPPPGGSTPRQGLRRRLPSPPLRMWPEDVRAPQADAGGGADGTWSAWRRVRGCASSTRPTLAAQVGVSLRRRQLLAGGGAGGDRGQRFLGVAAVEFQLLLGHPRQQGAALLVDRSAFEEDPGQGPAPGPSPCRERVDQALLIDQADLYSASNRLTVRSRGVLSRRATGGVSLTVAHARVVPGRGGCSSSKIGSRNHDKPEVNAPEARGPAGPGHSKVSGRATDTSCPRPSTARGRGEPIRPTPCPRRG